jgi:hypothetical protein
VSETLSRVVGNFCDISGWTRCFALSVWDRDVQEIYMCVVRSVRLGLDLQTATLY